jgi:hypothetical protein
MTIHKDLANGRWHTFSLCEQLGNVGSDVDRAIKWKNRGNAEDCEKAIFRALELLDLTIADPKHKRTRGRLKELGRVREVFLDYFLGDNQYGYTDEALSRYFYNYAITAALRKGK